MKIITDVSKKKTIRVGNVEIGGNKPIIIAGPCSVEDEEQVLKIALEVKNQDASILRGGAYKPRTSPYTFQGLGEEGLKYLKNAGIKAGLLTVSELLDIRDIDIVEGYVDIIQIGSRNMYNYPLLKEVGRLNKPVILKRGLSASIEEWMNAAEYIASNGNLNIILCERGIRTFETYTRNTLDLSAVPIIKGISCLPIIVDPSHGTGRRELIIPMSMAAIAAGADGVMVEVHYNPEEALSDGEQSLNFDEFARLCQRINDFTSFFSK
ncbi:phospho-2-dehydro-3-deoxyheptonate aldolase [Oxobacter pfennigii]|uniref:Phospho-2-dehydro-3-deoxyheptonate aldolase n=1 Tax=Oxobacter pfennigii TaxID=36849 RepID=A0A0P8YAI7_9CLOT|nr:3-deoxy-7-phosphoheptulonate synthase [Oxobacter pfennigii]KPU43993.1 phospho-2-dehydro-3-deoxyheptonate aldolase [Oxobacter pfennigii]